MKTFIAKTRSTGKEYNVRLCPITIETQYPELGVEGSHDKDAEIEIDGKWYVCDVTHVRDNNANLPVVRISKYWKDTLKALNFADLKKDLLIVLTEDWAQTYLEMLEESKKEFVITANNAVFNKITFMYHTTHKYMNFRWDSELDSRYIKYNDVINNLQEALKFVKSEELKEYQIGSDYDDYSISYYFEVPVSDIEKIITLSLPGLERAAKEKEHAEEVRRQNEEKRKNIDAGCVYFHCESAPHNEDLSAVILNRPAPNEGSFTLEHRISEQLFSELRPYARYYNAEFLEDCDMFTSSPGWRFSAQAIEKLINKLGKRVFVDNIECKDEKN